MIRMYAGAWFLFAALTAAPLMGQSSKDLAEGKKLYETAGSCVACHQPNGKGLPGAFPPLAGSDWVTDSNTDRLIAITLKGLQGPILVNGKPYQSMMPPQVLFNDGQIARILTYVRNAWGNKGSAVTEAQVTRLRKKLGPGAYELEQLMKDYPFTGAKAKTNGIFEPEAEQDEGPVLKPVVWRTFMPGASPAAFAVALPGGQHYCWDAGEVRLRYVWSKGGFLKNNKRHWSSNGKPVAQVEAVPYYRARSSLLEPKHYKDLAKTNMRKPFYDTHQAKDFPIAIGTGPQPRPRFEGMQLISGYPKFLYRLGDHSISELITVTEDRRGIRRRFEIDAKGQPVTLKLTPSKDAIFKTTAGRLGSDGTLKLTAAEAENFTVSILETDPDKTSGEAGR
ncbi:MAG: cytochrome c [Phycisphaeraceae bacterium]|nr:cytochrome c [Phycisphaeraceae bacterium]